MSTFDADLVRFRFAGSPNDRLGLTLVLDYDGETIYPTTILSGARQKYVLRSAGVILKVESYERRLHVADYDPQTFGEWAVWDALPDHLRPQFQPVVAHAWQMVEAPQPGDHPPALFLVIWSAQSWLEGRDAAVNREQFAAMVEAAGSAGFHPHDHKPGQIRTPPDGEPIWLDYGFFCRPGACRCEQRREWESGNISATLSVPSSTPTQQGVPQ